MERATKNRSDRDTDLDRGGRQSNRAVDELPLADIARQVKSADASPLTPKQIMQLQSTIGNQAVQRLLSDDQRYTRLNTDGYHIPTKTQLVQRQGQPGTSTTKAPAKQTKSDQSKLTKFQKRVQGSKYYTPVVDESNGDVIGYYRKSAGYEEIRDIHGRIRWSDEKGLEKPWLDPIDLIPIGAIAKVGIGVAKGLGKVFVLSITKKAGQKAVNATSRTIFSRLRATATKFLTKKTAAKTAAKAGSKITEEAIEQAIKKAPAEFQKHILAALASKAAGNFTVAFVKYGTVEVYKKGTKLFIDITFVQATVAGKGLWKRSFQALEQAAVAAAKSAGAKSVEVGYKTVVNPKFGDKLVKAGYNKLVRTTANGVTSAWAKALTP